MAELSSEKMKIVPFSDSSLAYELRDFEERHMKRGRQPVQRTRRRTAPKARAIALPSISVFAAAAFATLMILLLMVVYSYMQLNEITTTNSRMQRQIDSLEVEQAKLDTALEQRISLKELEERALALGMVQPDGDQIQWFDLSGEDYAVVVESSDGWLEDLGDAVSGVFGSILE